MYDWLKGLILPWLRIEDSEPHPPAGHESHEMLRIERADPGFLRLRLLQWRLYAVAWAVVVVLASVAMLVADWRLLLLVIPLVLFAVAKAATFYVTTRLDYEMRWYVITDRSLLIREGVWNVQEITITFANAQNVRVTQGPLERWFGFSNVEVETAGGGGSGEPGSTRHRARLSGLANPQEVRGVILDVIRQQRTAGLGDPDDLEAERLPARGVSEAWSTDAASSSAVSLPGDLLREVWSEARALRVALESSAIHFDEELYRRLKIEAARQGRTVREMVAEGVRYVLDGHPDRADDELSPVGEWRPEWLGVLRPWASGTPEHSMDAIRGSIERGRMDETPE